MLLLKVIKCRINKWALYLQCIGDWQTHEARIETLLPSHGKQRSKQHHAVPDELDTHAKPPMSEQGYGSNKSWWELKNSEVVAWFLFTRIQNENFKPLESICQYNMQYVKMKVNMQVLYNNSDSLVSKLQDESDTVRIRNGELTFWLSCPELLCMCLAALVFVLLILLWDYYNINRNNYCLPYWNYNYHKRLKN